MKVLFLSYLWLLLAVSLFAQKEYYRYFENKAIRMEFAHYGNSQSEGIAFERWVEEPIWAHSKYLLIDDRDRGMQRIELYDTATNLLLYRQNYSTLFNEWQTIPEAEERVRSYPEAIRFPRPKSDAYIVFYTRTKEGQYKELYRQVFRPEREEIVRGEPRYEVIDLRVSGGYDKKIDIAILGDGYTDNEMSHFVKHANNFVDTLLTYAPFSEMKDRFNFRAIFTASEHSGITTPETGRWMHSALGSKFGTIGSDRYLMVDDSRWIKSVAASAPYDYIYILGNTEKYGGGGIYNFYAIGAALHPTKAGKVHVHEFAHLFLGLGDEYSASGLSNQLYPEGVEPWEPNLTRLIQFETKSWAKKVDPTTPIPTPIGYELPLGTVGVYEGGGYIERDIYRPAESCMMRDLTDFCPVCQEALRHEILRLTEEKSNEHEPIQTETLPSQPTLE